MTTHPSTKKSDLVILRETPIQSIIADVFTFGCIGFLLYANHRWLGDHALVAVLLAVMAIISASAKGPIIKNTFTSKDDAIKHIQSL